MRNWLLKIKKFFSEVWEEFQKCTRPSRSELLESTLVVVFTMTILGVFIFGADWVIKLISDFTFNV